MQTVLQAVAPAVALASCLSISPAAQAGPSDYVISPIVEEGEREIDFKAGSAKLRDGTRESAHSLGFGWGATRWWFTEIYAKWHKPPGEKYGFDAWEWENKFQLTETGQYPVDLGWLLEIERPKDRREGYEFRWGPLLQTELTNSVQANLNLLLEKHVQSSSPAKAQLGYQWQLKYRWQPALEFGVQGFGDVGPWNNWQPASRQSHSAGPVLLGRIAWGGRQTIKYNVGVLLGLNNASPQTTARLQAEYEF